MKSYRIYFNDNTLYIADSIPNQIEKIQQLSVNDFSFLDFYKTLRKGGNKHYALIDENPKALFKKIKKKLNIIKAAGGLVANANGDFLFIFRNKKWDLPKGKVEKGEKIKITAVREVEEECGVTIEKREDLLCKTYHVYELEGKVILKRTTWYKMKVKGSPKLIPQVEEGITTASWVAPLGIKAKMKNTYPLILDVLKAGGLV
ncbi:MAG: NUDIX domain-containing protein [Bacteroidota bacterium]|uniref:NUDIX domain-containing protein n=1 Tax=Pedobacter cryotolerans TaxID=2571270 RepID=A0A4U1CA33_9SPHI|nr:NUDIX domain-containing protein [Pedobacter cryotolerans]TKC01309.1 NUDIX domain-containing protein [Pedobacter cryotolerans]